MSEKYRELFREAETIRTRLKSGIDSAARKNLKARYQEIERLITALKQQEQQELLPPIAPTSESGHIQTMACPRCRKPASEYDINKWKCLSCGTKFIYEPPAEPIKPDLYVRQDVKLLDEGMLYTCPQCKTQFRY